MKMVPYSPLASSLVSTPSPSVSLPSTVGQVKWCPPADPWMCWGCGWPGTSPFDRIDTFNPPSSVAVSTTVPPAPLSFSSTRSAFTVVSATATAGQHSSAAAAAKVSKVRFMVFSLPPGCCTR
jgi:hypothetical protein